MRYELDIYNGAGVEATPCQDAGTVKRVAIRAARQLAQRNWDHVGIVTPADDDVISFGPLGDDGYGTDQYVTVRRVR
jgi:hypothetical protein